MALKRADLDQHRFHCGGRSVVVLGGLGAAFAGNAQINVGLAYPRFCAHRGQKESSLQQLAAQEKTLLVKR